MKISGNMFHLFGHWNFKYKPNRNEIGNAGQVKNQICFFCKKKIQNGKHRDKVTAVCKIVRIT